jgi:hypothetical protein
MRRKSRTFFKNCALLGVCCGIAAFAQAITLVKSRQNIILIGRKISELEQNLASYATKNSELDAKILRLGASESLRPMIAERRLVAMDKRNTVKISSADAGYYAMNQAKKALSGEFASKNFSKQTNLTMGNR